MKQEVYDKILDDDLIEMENQYWNIDSLLIVSGLKNHQDIVHLRRLFSRVDSAMEEFRDEMYKFKEA